MWWFSLSSKKWLLCNQFDCCVCFRRCACMRVLLLGYASKSVVCVRCAVLPIWSQNARLQRPVPLCLCADTTSLRGSESWLHQAKFSTPTKVSLCQARPAISPSEEAWEYHLVKDYFGGTSLTELKPQRLPFSDARLTEAWTSRNSPGSYLSGISTETRIMSQTCIVSWSLVWRQCSRSNHQGSILKEFLLRHGSRESN